MQKFLDDILEKEDTVSQLTLLKCDQKNFSFTALKKEVRKLERIRDLYRLSKEVIPQLRLSKNCIGHYCELVEQFTSYRLKQFSKPYARLYVLCYVYYRYEQISDHLVISFQYHVERLRKKAKEYVDKCEQEYNSKLNIHLPNVSNLLRWMVNDKIEKTSPYSIVLEEAYNILPHDQFIPMANFLDGKKFNRESVRWEFYGDSSKIIAMYLRNTFLTLEFSSLKLNSQLMKAIALLKKHYGANKAPSQMDLSGVINLVPKNKRSQMYCIKKNTIALDPARFEFFVYSRIEEKIGKGLLFCPESLSYKDLKDDFVSKDILANKEEIVKNLGYPRIISFSTQRLIELDDELHDAWLRTNRNIADGTNNGIKIKHSKKGTTWSLSYDALDDDESDSVLDKLPQTEISDLVSFIFNKCNTTKAFTHIKPYRSKQKPNLEKILACIFADAFGCGIGKMADMSDLNFNQLNSTHHNMIRVETLKKANDYVVNYIVDLEIFNHWNIIDKKLLGDADGQKFESKLQTIQARHSSKFFGLSKGISTYSLVANNVPINSKNISPNDHESHFTFDIIYNNTSNIKPDMITGDAHSINQLNFSILDVINVQFVPIYKDIVGKSTSIYCIKDPKQYKGLIKPAGQIDMSLIEEQKENMQLLFLSLVMQETTQSIIVKKLASHKRHSRLKKALWEYNKILSSIHLLNLIDDPQLRRNLRRARNRTESYHQLQSRIRKVHGGKFRGTSIIENEIWNQSARLVANCIIAHNGTILSKSYAMNKDHVKTIAKISPIAWQNINLAGRYSFKGKRKIPNIKNIVQLLMKMDFSNKQ